MDKTTKLFALACELAGTDPDFQLVRGPGAGNRATNAFMSALRNLARTAFGKDYCEQSLCGETQLRADFYFPDEATIVEVALGLPNPNTEFEKDILKAIMAQDEGHKVRRLFFISRAGAAQKCAQPGRSAISAWAFAKHGLRVEIHELDGEPRKRIRGPQLGTMQ